MCDCIRNCLPSLSGWGAEANEGAKVKQPESWCSFVTRPFRVVLNCITFVVVTPFQWIASLFYAKSKPWKECNFEGSFGDKSTPPSEKAKKYAENMLTNLTSQFSNHQNYAWNRWRPIAHYFANFLDEHRDVRFDMGSIYCPDSSFGLAITFSTPELFEAESAKVKNFNYCSCNITIDNNKRTFNILDSNFRMKPN